MGLYIWILFGTFLTGRNLVCHTVGGSLLGILISSYFHVVLLGYPQCGVSVALFRRRTSQGTPSHYGNFGNTCNLLVPYEIFLLSSQEVSIPKKRERERETHPLPIAEEN